MNRHDRLKRKVEKAGMEGWRRMERERRSSGRRAGKDSQPTIK